jgi:hypothetical protein
MRPAAEKDFGAGAAGCLTAGILFPAAVESRRDICLSNTAGGRFKVQAIKPAN